MSVSIDGVVLGTASVAVDGTWLFTTPAALADGSHTVTARQSDAAGNTGSLCPPVGFVVDATAPAPPVIQAPLDQSVTTEDRPEIRGTGEPGATVTVRDGDLAVDGQFAVAASAPSSLIGHVPVAADGSWSLNPATPLADGEHTFSATQEDPAGNRSPIGNRVRISVDTEAPAAPVVTFPRPGAVITTDRPTITGTGEPAATAAISLDGVRVGTAVVASDGGWSFRPGTALTRGAHTVSVTQTDQVGHTSPATRVGFSLAAATPTGPGSTSTTGSPSSSSTAATSGGVGASTSGGSGTTSTAGGGSSGTGALARTGAEVGLLAGLGAILLVLGAALTRRRRRRD